MDNIKIHENINEKEQNPFETNINYMKYLFFPPQLSKSIWIA